MTNDNELVMLEAMLFALEGKSPSLAIEMQERRGQQEVVRLKVLPKKMNWTRVPKTVREKGCSPFNNTKENLDIEKVNIIAYAREKYEALGIEILGELNDLFYEVKLPEGWLIRETDHYMWSELVDDKGTIRASLFYKAAFYDRDAFINFTED